MSTATSNDLLEALSEYELGPFEFATATGASTRSVERWLAGAWLLTPSRALDYARPAEAIRAGRAKEVLAFLEAIAEGVYI